MTKLSDVLIKHRDINKETLQSLVLGVDNALELIPLQFDSTGSIAVSNKIEIPTRIERGFVGAVLPATESLLISYIVPMGNTSTIISACLTGNGYGTFRMEYEGVTIGKISNSYFQRVIFWTQKLELVENEELKIYVTNDTIEALTNDYEAWLYMREETT